MIIPPKFKELEVIRSFAGSFCRHPKQINKLLEADAEILNIDFGQEDLLVVKTDGIYEEISEGLYSDPYMIGWMGVTVTLSDIAAVNAVPIGILLSVVIPNSAKEEWVTNFKQGINEACAAYDIHVLGGDTNYGEVCSINTTAIAVLKNRKSLLRTGMMAGNLLYATSFLGSGNAFAYSKLFDSSVINYHPVARLKESASINAFASSCMDTSDGLFPALAVLSELNKVGFSIEPDLHTLLDKQTKQVQQKAGLPSWMFLAGPHGDYELLFSIPERNDHEFKMNCKMYDWEPLFLGRAIDEIVLNFNSDGLHINCPPAAIPNLFYEAKGNVQSYFIRLQEHHHHWLTINQMHETRL